MSDSGRNSGAARVAAQELETLVFRLGEEIAAFRRRAQTAEARVKALEEELDEARTRAAEAVAQAMAAREVAERQAEEEPGASDPQLEAAPAPPAAESDGRFAALQQENDELRARLEGAASRTRQMLERLRFLRQQHSLGGPR